MSKFNPLLERNSIGKPIVINCKGKGCEECEEYISCLCSEQIKLYERLAQYEENTKCEPEDCIALAKDLNIQANNFIILGNEYIKAQNRIFELMEENYRLKVENDRFKENKIPTQLAPKANWKTWAGWGGNHDQRIQGAECSHCGYIHPTVRGSLSKLSERCPKCDYVMDSVEYGPNWIETINRRH